MAKGSKSSKSEPPAPKKKAAPKKAAAAKSAGAGMPGIDTSLAAESAARMLAARGSKRSGATPPAHPESAMFRQMKAGLSKPHSTAMSNLLDKSHGPEPAKTHPQLKQVGHNQTFGADAARTGVPRRTPG